MFDSVVSPVGGLIAGLAVGVGIGCYILWRWLDVPSRYERPDFSKSDLVKIYEDSDKLSKKRTYAYELTQVIEDISEKASKIEDDLMRAQWLEYVKELQIRQLILLKKVHDHKYEDIQLSGVSDVENAD